MEATTPIPKRRAMRVGETTQRQRMTRYEARMIAGNTAKDTEGCILLGENKQRGMVLNSRATLEKFIAKLKTAWDIGESVTIKIADK